MVEGLLREAGDGGDKGGTRETTGRGVGGK